MISNGIHCLLRSFTLFCYDQNIYWIKVDVNWVNMAYTPHSNTQASRGFSGGLTFGLSPSMFSCISCATVCSRILFSSACCRRSFINSRVSSSGCKGREGGREGQKATTKQGHTAGGVGEDRRKHIGTRDLDVLGCQ